MNFKNYFWSFALAITPFLSSPVSAFVGEPISFSRGNATKVVFRVYGQASQGSGVLVKLPDGKFAILTAKHVLSGMTDKELIEIQLPKNNFITIPRSDTLDIKDKDLSIILINDKRQLDTASFSINPSIMNQDSLINGEKIYTVGFPLDSNLNVSPAIRVTNGEVQTIDKDGTKDGYDIGYTSKTYIGMSGGAVFNQKGHLIGIHGRGEALSSSDVNKTGTNFAINANSIFNWYRNTQIKIVDYDLEAASKYIKSSNFSDGLDIWKSTLKTYPDSPIANYNVNCLKSIVNKDNSKILKLYPNSEWGPIFSFNAYLEDPLVMKYMTKNLRNYLKFDYMRATYKQTWDVPSGPQVQFQTWGRCLPLLLNGSASREIMLPFIYEMPGVRQY